MKIKIAIIYALLPSVFSEISNNIKLIKMIYQFIKYIGCVAVFLSVMACDGKLDVAPTQSIDQNKALNSAQDVQITLIGAYDGLSNVFGGEYQFLSDLVGDDREVVFGGTFSSMDEIWRKTITTSNTQIRTTWLNTYAAINRANNVIGALDKVSADNRAKVEGEARFIRGLLYFGLVKSFGKTWGDGDNNTNLAVPLSLTPTTVITDADYKARSTVSQVYTQILEDLIAAEKLLPTQTASDNSGFATRDGASALLSRVYMMQGEYAKARDAAHKVILSEFHTLSHDFAEIFNDKMAGHAAEVLFKVVVTDQDGVNSLNTYYASASYQGRGDIRVQQKHLNLYDTTDVRGKFFNKSGGNTFTNKHTDQYGDVIVIRLAEMFLNRAECNARLTTTVGATPLVDVNTIRVRVGLDSLRSVTLEAILKERKLELAFEGNLLDDLKRTKRPIGTTPFSDNKLVLPIPQREIDINKKIIQNAGY
jgi:starch-binding outer membrane protein, SusD/RagB family